MCTILLLIYGLFCGICDFFSWVGRKVMNISSRPKNTKEHKHFNEPLSQKELLTFEELYEDE